MAGEEENVELVVTCPRCDTTHVVEVPVDDLLPNPDTEKMYKLKEVERILNLSRRTIRQYISDGKLKATKFGADKRSAWRVSASDLREFRKSRGDL